MIDWSKLKHYQNDKRKSFEELCYQISKKLYGYLGMFTSIDDSGGGDGVEFFLTLLDGAQWGWQAKFYYPNLRLNDSRKKSITNSLSTSLAHHPHLTKWFLCTPTNFTASDNELTWFETTLKGLASNVELIHWGDSDFSDMLSDPQMVGKRHYFFGELELTPDWFTTTVTKQLANVREKFLDRLHTETAIDHRIHCLLGDQTLLGSLTQCHDEMQAALQAFQASLSQLHKYSTDEAWKSDAANLIPLGEALSAQVNSALAIVSACGAHVADGRIEEAQVLDLEPIVQSIHADTQNYQRCYYTLYRERIRAVDDLSEEERKANERAQYVLRKLQEPLTHIAAISAVLSRAHVQLQDFRRHDLHIFGQAGIGKTHITCHACTARVLSGLPAILLLGGQFNRTQTIEQRIRHLCDIPPSYSWGDFLATLEAYAEAYHTRVLIAIDALNEAESIEIWRQELPGFITHLAPSRRSALITMCRSRYREAIWGDRGAGQLCLCVRISWGAPGRGHR